jgi:hypothetical protein
MNPDPILTACALGCFVLAALNVPVTIVRPINLFNAGVAFLTATLVF